MKVQSVLGDLSPNQLGYTLTHEHLSLHVDRFYTPCPEHLKGYVTDRKKISLDNLGVLRQYPYSSRYNIIFNDEEAHEKVVEDLKLLKQWCGSNCTIFENTTHGIHRDLEFCREAATRTGVNVVAGTGHYIESAQRASDLSVSLEALSDLYTKELVAGVDVSISQNGSDIIKCGFIGEVGSTWPITDFEKRAIKAAAEVQSVLGCGVSFHPDRDPKAPFEIMRLYLEAGGNASKCIMSHLDRTFKDDETLLEFAKLGTYCQFDLFGVECSLYQLNLEFDMPSDAQRIQKVLRLIKEGREDRILMSHDIHTKHRLLGYGGHGYSHILNNVIPKLRAKGLTEEQIDKITISNPAKWIECDI